VDRGFSVTVRSSRYRIHCVLGRSTVIITNEESTSKRHKAKYKKLLSGDQKLEVKTLSKVLNFRLVIFEAAAERDIAERAEPQTDMENHRENKSG